MENNIDNNELSLALRVAQKCIGFDLPITKAEDIPNEIEKLVTKGIRKMLMDKHAKAEVSLDATGINCIIKTDKDEYTYEQQQNNE